MQSLIADTVTNIRPKLIQTGENVKEKRKWIRRNMTNTNATRREVLTEWLHQYDDVNYKLSSSRSPHLNLILEQHVRRRSPSSKHQMRDYLFESMMLIPPLNFQRLVESDDENWRQPCVGVSFNFPSIYYFILRSFCCNVCLSPMRCLYGSWWSLRFMCAMCPTRLNPEVTSWPWGSTASSTSSLFRLW